MGRQLIQRSGQRSGAHQRPGAHQRSGSILICVLACLVIVTGLIMAISRQALEARRETKFRLQVRQTELLLDAGVVRAAKRSQQSPEYKGETWQPTDHRPSDAADRIENAVVTIQVNPSDSPDQRNIRVIASIGGAPSDEPIPSRTVQTHEFTITLSQPKPNDVESDDE